MAFYGKMGRFRLVLFLRNMYIFLLDVPPFHIILIIKMSEMLMDKGNFEIGCGKISPFLLIFHYFLQIKYTIMLDFTQFYHLL